MQLIIYAGDLLVGVWPWGTLWGRDARAAGPWTLRRRLFQTPAVSAQDAPWVDYIQGKTGEYSNAWGQRVEGACLLGGDAYFTTSAKNYGDVQGALGLLPEASQAEYGHVFRISAPGQVSGHFEWREETTLSFNVTADGTGGAWVAVHQDGAPLAARRVARCPAGSPPAGRSRSRRAAGSSARAPRARACD